MNTKFFIFILTGLVSYSGFSQVKIGQWIDHLSYNYANAVSKVGNNVYVSNGQGLAKYDDSDNSIEKLTKINGLSDVGIKTIKKNDYNDALLVIYNNSNIDIIKPNGTIISHYYITYDGGIWCNETLLTPFRINFFNW